MSSSSSPYTGFSSDEEGGKEEETETEEAQVVRLRSERLRRVQREWESEQAEEREERAKEEAKTYWAVDVFRPESRRRVLIHVGIQAMIINALPARWWSQKRRDRSHIGAIYIPAAHHSGVISMQVDLFTGNDGPAKFTLIRRATDPFWYSLNHNLVGTYGKIGWDDVTLPTAQKQRCTVM